MKYTPSCTVKESCIPLPQISLSSAMHLLSFIMHHVMHSIMLSKASFITCSAYQSEKTRVDQVSEKVHPPLVLVSSLTLLDPLWKLTFSATQASLGAYHHSLVFTNLYYTLSLVRCALSNQELVEYHCCMITLIYMYPQLYPVSMNRSIPLMLSNAQTSIEVE